MSKYGSNSIVVMFDNAAGSPVDMSQHILSINAVDVEALMEESHAFGDAWFESLATGLRKMNDLTVEGLFDDAASTGPNVIFNDVADGPSDTTRTITITWGGTKTTSVETLIQKYTRTAARGSLTKYSVTLRPTGLVTEV